MPYYEYQCRDCGHFQDESHSVNNAPSSTICEKCAGHAHKLISAPGFIIRGVDGPKGPSKGRQERNKDGK